MFLFDNREALAQAGYFVPTSLNRPSGRDRGNSWLLAAYARDDAVFDDTMRAEAAVVDAASLARFRTDIAAALGDEVAAAPAGCHTMILSNEHCHSALPQPHEVAALRHLLDPFCAGYRVLVYLRAQAELAISVHAMAVKNGLIDTVMLPRFGQPTEQDWLSFGYFDYDALLNRWAGVFSAGGIDVRRYGPGLLRNGDVVDDMLNWLGLPDAGYHRPGKVNASLAAPAQHFLTGLTRALEGFEADDVQWVQHWATPRLVVSSAGRGILPARSEVACFMAQFEAVNEAVRARWFPGLRRLFELDLAAFPERVEPPPEAPAEFYGEVIRMLLVERDLVERARRGLPPR